MTKRTLKIRRHYVSMACLIKGERVERELSDEETERLRIWQSDRMMNAVGYERKKHI